VSPPPGPKSPLPEVIIDVHAHLWKLAIGDHRYFSEEALAGWAENFALGNDRTIATETAINADAAMLIEALDVAEHGLGCEYRICVFAIDLRPLFPMAVPVADLNDWVIDEAANDRRGRILPFACINPTLPDAVGEVARAAARGARGFKLYPPTGFFPDEEAALPFYEAVLRAQESSARPLPVLLHQGFSYSGSRYARPVHMQDVAFRFGPDLKLIGAHAGSPWTDEAVWVAAVQQNVYLDISALGDLVGWWPELHAEVLGKAKRAGALGRILYGTDWPLSAYWLPPDDGLSWRNLHEVAHAVSRLRMPERLLELGYPEITPDDLRGVLGENALALFGERS
jgi:predicted TIM-barrel fold metal-dependent hydrolase